MGTSKNNSKENLEINDTSLNIKEENLNLLKNIFPHLFDEDKLDIDKLKDFLGENIIDEKTIEKYSLSWAGKSDAFKAIRIPSIGTLVKDNKGINEDNTENIFIEGDNLEVLKLLQKHYYNKIKMIYIDPPYNTGKDFVYKDNFTESVESYYEMTGQTEGGIKMTANTEKNGRFHSDWLTMMYPRLFLARNLLKDDGVIFVSIDDNEVANLRLIMDEIFGEENFIETFIWKKKGGASNTETIVGDIFEYILMYSKNINNVKTNRRLLESKQYSNKDENGFYFLQSLLKTDAGQYKRDTMKYGVKNPLDGIETFPPEGKRWTIGKEKMQEYLELGLLEFVVNKDGVKDVRRKEYFIENDVDTGVYLNLLLEKGSLKSAKTELENLDFGREEFDTPKPSILIKHLLEISTGENDIILDFFAGSGTTAHAVMDLNAEDGGNRKWICVQLPELTDEKSEAYKAEYKTISEISRERIKRAGYKYMKEISEKKRDDKFDFGFKTFSLTKSNFKKWNTMNDSNSIEEIMKQAKLLIDDPFDLGYELDTEKLEKIQERVVCEIFLKEGFDLNSEIKKEGDVFVVVEKIEEKERKIFISFAKSVSEKDVEKLKLGDDDTFVCFDSALTDTIKVNIVREVNLKVM